ncbi:MAG: TolC family protein, partial [Bacteroides sp.]|nr:TolC family protein [Bacteroides sp.]
MKKNILLYLCIVCVSVQVNAQEGWTLRQCIDYAVKHNIDIRRSANTAEQSSVEVNTAKWARLPNLNGSGSQSWNWGRTQTAIKDEKTGDYSTVYVNTNSNST